MIEIVQRFRAAGRTAVFMFEVLPMLPSRAVDWITPTPVVEHAPLPEGNGLTDLELYRPNSPGPHPGVVVCLGVVPFGTDHPQVPRLGKALARAGFVALLYWSPAMRDQRLDPSDVEGIALAYRWLVGRPFVDPTRSGLMGTCVGGSFALLAAASPAIRDRVSFVGAFAPYASMSTLARQIATRTRSAPTGADCWEVDPLTRRVFVRSVTDHLRPEEAEILRSVGGPPGGQIDPRVLSEEGRAIAPLLGTVEKSKFDDILRQLPAKLQARMAVLTPIRYLSEIRAPLVVLAHDVDDPVIPIDQSRSLRDGLAGRTGVHYTEFTMFKHLDPTKVHLTRVALARELLRFGRMLYPMFRVATDPS